MLILLGLFTWLFAFTTSYPQIDVITESFYSAAQVESFESFVALTASSLEALKLLFLSVLGLCLIVIGARSTAKQDQRERDEKPVEPSKPQESSPDESFFTARELLSQLQEKARLLDFSQQDISKYNDEQVGQVARIIHQGLTELFSENISVEPLHPGKEGDRIVIKEQEQLQKVRFVGGDTSKDSNNGVVVHRGWRARQITLAKPSSKEMLVSDIIQPIEVEADSI